MIHRILFIFCLLGLGAAGADVSGRWVGTLKLAVDGSEVEMPHELVLKQQGDAVSGTAGPGAEQQWPIGKGRLQGTELTLEVKVPDGPLFEYKLTVSAGEISGDYKMTLEGQTSLAKLSVKKQ